MGYEPTIDPPITLFPRDEAAARQDQPETPARDPRRDTARREPLGVQRPLRFGGLSLDALTGRVEWQGKLLALREDEIELLQALMRNAGRILSPEQLASQLAERPELVEGRLRSLHGSLRVAGVKCLPRHANGLGYILWY